MAENAGSENGGEAPDDAVDDRKVETAVKFLQNAKVQATPMARRVKFLEQKGLNKAEIRLAVEQSGSVEYEPPLGQSQPNVNRLNYEHQSQAPPHQVTHVTNRPSWSSIVLTAILGGGVAYVMNRIVKTYVAPLFLGKEKKDHLMEQLIKSMKSFEERHIEMASGLKTSFDNIENLLEKQQLSLNSLRSSNSEQSPISDVVAYSEIKSELTSMKSLLLARNQFPPTPFSQSSPGAAIPAWQKAAALKKQATSDRKSASDSELPNGDEPQQSSHKSHNTPTKSAESARLNGSNSVNASSDEENTSIANPTLSSTFVKVES